MGTLRMLWFFLWRTSLLGAVLCAASLVAMTMLVVIGSALASNTSESNELGAGLFWLAVMDVVTGVLGAILGLALGLLGGLVLFALTRISHYPSSSDIHGYPRMAGRACAAASGLVLLGDWLICNILDPYGGFLDPYCFILWRLLGSGSSSDGSFDFTSTVNLTLEVIFPVLLLVGAMWFSGRKVAGQYARKAGGSEAANDSSAAESMPESWT